MNASDILIFDQALALARHLPAHDRARLIARLVEELVEPLPPTSAAPAHFVLPVITGGTWSDSLPLSRKELYDYDERR